MFGIILVVSEEGHFVELDRESIVIIRVMLEEGKKQQKKNKKRLLIFKHKMNSEKEANHELKHVEGLIDCLGTMRANPLMFKNLTNFSH